MIDITTEQQIRIMAIDFALKTPNTQNSEDILAAAKAYGDFIMDIKSSDAKGGDAT